jgi:hypothetical protein
MTILALIRKGVLDKAATTATIATQQQKRAATVAKVSTVAVASPRNLVSEPEPFDRQAWEKRAAIAESPSRCCDGDNRDNCDKEDLKTEKAQASPSVPAEITKNERNDMKHNPAFDVAQKYLNRDDPILTADQWLPHFRELHDAVIPEFDYEWLKKQRPDVYASIKAKERELDQLAEARLSQIMEIMTEWRRLVLQADREWERAGKQPK